MSTVMLPLFKITAIGNKTFMIEEIYKRVQQRLEDLGLTAAEASKEAGLSKDAIRNMGRAVNSASRQGVSTNTLEKLAPILETSAAWLFTGHDPNLRIIKESFRKVFVTRWVQAGFTNETWEWPEDDWKEVWVPNTYQGTLYGAEIRGNSMNRVYTEGSMIVFNDISETQESFKSGKRYVFERSNSLGEHEYTVKTLHRDETGKYWLVPESDDLLQEPIALEAMENDNSINILGRVMYSIKEE